MISNEFDLCHDLLFISSGNKVDLVKLYAPYARSDTERQLA